MTKRNYSNEPAILSVTTSDGNVLYHTSKGLVGYELRDYATRFKTLTHAMKVGRQKYSRLFGGYLTGWTATTQIPETANRAEDSESKLSID
jgi:hypothetical protein